MRPLGMCVCLLGKQAGPFEREVEWIKVERVGK
jgi:hypothetical protein